MFTTLKQWHKSKTIWFGHFIALVGILEANIGLLRNNLGDYYGYAFILLSAVTYILRQQTTKPISEK